MVKPDTHTSTYLRLARGCPVSLSQSCEAVAWAEYGGFRRPSPTQPARRERADAQRVGKVNPRSPELSVPE